MNGELEQWATTIYQEQGNDPSEPDFQTRVGEIASTMREAAPGADDATIIAQVGPVVQQKIAAARSIVPAPSKVATPESDAYVQQLAQLQERFSPEAEQAQREKVRNSWANIGAEAGRTLSMGARMSANPAQTRALDEMYQSAKQVAEQPYADWQATKKAAVADLEQKIKAQAISRDEARFQMTKIGFDQAQEERASAQAYNAAINDPTSAHSEALRAMARQKFPKFAEGLGARFDTLSYAMLKDQIPALEKQFLKELELQDKEIGRRFEAEEKERDRVARRAEFDAAERGRNARTSATIAAANARAASRTAAPAGAGQLDEEGLTEGRTFDSKGRVKDISPVIKNNLAKSRADAEGAAISLPLLAQLEAAVSDVNAPESGFGAAVGAAGNFLPEGMKPEISRTFKKIDSARQALLANLNDPRMKGNPTNVESAAVANIIADPSISRADKIQRVKLLRARMEEMLNQHNTAVSSFNEGTRALLKGATLDEVGANSYGGGKTGNTAGGTVTMTKDGKTFAIPADKVGAARAQGYK